MSAGTWWLAKLSFERVQTYLFAVPELRSMVGANTLLGEALRGRLVEGGFASGSLPGLAVQSGSALPPGVGEDGWPDAGEDDPLGAEDDPRRAASLGVLARDGGHLHAVFPKEEGARAFIQRARGLVANRLPGLLLGARLARLEKGPKGWQKSGDEDAQPAPGESIADLPVFQVCNRSGQGPASEPDTRGRGDGPPSWIAESVAARREAVGRFHDSVLGRMRPFLVGDDRPFPMEFQEVAGQGYLAVIHSDGNNIGRRSMAARGEGDFFHCEARGESFFHAMRRVVRKAFVQAAEVFRHEDGAVRFRPLMLGGDDLLLVCDARWAMKFVKAYAAALRDAGDLPDKKGPLHAAAGVAIVKEKFPFHRAHALAEQLAASAKKLGREDWAVDWLTFSEAWHDDIADARRRDAIVRYEAEEGRETLLLSRKPYRVLGKGLTLETLLGSAANVDAPRSQLISLGAQVPLGRHQADWELGLLRGTWQGQLAAALHEGPPRSLWSPEGEGRWATAYLDFLELVELDRMGREREGRR